jgi:hypothetical protein
MGEKVDFAPSPVGEVPIAIGREGGRLEIHGRQAHPYSVVKYLISFYKRV